MLLGNNSRLEYPAGSFEALNPVAKHGFGPLAAAWQAQELRRFALSHPWRTVYFTARTLRSRLEASANEPPPGISAATIFALPDEWTRDERIEFNLGQYKKYVRSIDKLASKRGARCAHFIQPCPAIGKTLTDDEKRLAGDLGYGAAYRRMADGLMTLRDEGVPIVDLRDVFSETSETVYGDQIHCKSSVPAPGDQFQPSEGYRLMAQAMVEHLAELWSLAPANVLEEQ